MIGKILAGCISSWEESSWWGLKVNGGEVIEVIYSERKPMLVHFSRVKRTAFDADPFPGIESLDVVRVAINETGSPELLAKEWFSE